MDRTPSFRIKNEEIRSDVEYPRFRPTLWFNDQIINAYLQYLSARFPDCILVHSMTTSQMTSTPDSRGTRNFMQNYPVDGKRLVLFPINIGNFHWVLGVYQVPSRRVVIYDSMDGQAVRQTDLQRLVAAIVTWSGQDVLHREITPMNIQLDKYNCGPYVLAMMECLCHQLDFVETLGGPSTTKSSISFFRKRILVRLWQDKCRFNDSHQCRGTTRRGTRCLRKACLYPSDTYRCRQHINDVIHIDDSDDDDVIEVD